jgi:hypothetical protein
LPAPVFHRQDPASFAWPQEMKAFSRASPPVFAAKARPESVLKIPAFAAGDS